MHLQSQKYSFSTINIDAQKRDTKNENSIS